MAEYKLTINGRLDGLNEYTKQNRINKYTGNICKRKNERRIQSAMIEQLNGVKIEKPVYIDFLWVEKDHRRDLDNIAFAKKFFLDAAQKEGLLIRDDFRYVKGFTDRFDFDKDNPRIEITIREID